MNGVRVEVLNPPCLPESKRPGSSGCAGQINDHSLVMRLTFGRVSVLLTGDIAEEAEQRLLEGPSRLRAVLLKVPHHGSPSSSRRTLLDAAAPGVAVVSAGYDNHFGFPSEEVLDRYREKGIVLYRTDLDGAVRCSTDGRSVWIETYQQRGGRSRAICGVAFMSLGQRGKDKGQRIEEQGVVHPDAWEIGR